MLLQRFRRAARGGLACAALLAAGISAAGAAQPAPSAIEVGTLYASSGAFAAISMPAYQGLKLWARQVNADGGVFVKPYGKRIPVKLVAYDDLSSTSTATTLYNQLITQDKVDILVADAGSVLSSVAVPLAKEHGRLLFNQSGTGDKLFSADNPYNVLLDDPVSSLWPARLVEFLTQVAPRQHIRRVAILYSTNDFTGAQAEALRKDLGEAQARSGVSVVYDQGVPTSTTNYFVLLRQIQAAHPDAVIELGYPGNDVAFLKALHQSGMKFGMVFAIYPGLETELLAKSAGAAALKGVFTYVPATGVHYRTGFGMDIGQFASAYRAVYGAQVDVGFNAVAGYNTGLVIQKALAGTASLKQTDLRQAVYALSGKLHTLDGAFKLGPDGAQLGEVMPIGQLQAGAKGLRLVPVYPPEVAKARPVLAGAR